MSFLFRYAALGTFLVAAGFAGHADANVVINGTRVIYPSEDKEVTVKLSNDSAQPMLVQVWLDNGDEKSAPEKIKTPFTLTPPISRIEPGKGQAVRVLYTQDPLPSDKETLFWFNMLEVPPKPADAEGRNLLQFAFRTRIKFIFRPKGLAGNAADAYQQLSWKLVSNQDNKGLALQVSNPTPYYVNFAHVGIMQGDKRELEQGGMVAPGATTVFQLTKLQGQPSADAKATFDVINDFGAVAEHDQALSR